MSRVIDATGGEQNIRRQSSVVKEVSIDYETQGIKGNMIVFNKAPNLSADHVTLTALARDESTNQNRQFAQIYR